MRTRRSSLKRPRRNKEEQRYVDEEGSASASCASDPYSYFAAGCCAFKRKPYEYSYLRQSFSEDGSKVIASASTLEAEVRAQLGGSAKGGNVAAAALIGKRIAEKAKAVGIEKVAFDRSGFAYHGRVKALAEAAREAGLQF